MTAAEGGWGAAALCPLAAHLKYDSSKERGKEAVGSLRLHPKNTLSPKNKLCFPIGKQFFSCIISFLSKNAPSGEAFSLQYLGIFRALPDLDIIETRRNGVF